MAVWVLLLLISLILTAKSSPLDDQIEDMRSRLQRLSSEFDSYAEDVDLAPLFTRLRRLYQIPPEAQPVDGISPTRQETLAKLKKLIEFKETAIEQARRAIKQRDEALAMTEHLLTDLKQKKNMFVQKSHQSEEDDQEADFFGKGTYIEPAFFD